MKLFFELAKYCSFATFNVVTILFVIFAIPACSILLLSGEGMVSIQVCLMVWLYFLVPSILLASTLGALMVFLLVRKNIINQFYFMVAGALTVFMPILIIFSNTIASALQGSSENWRLNTFILLWVLFLMFCGTIPGYIVFKKLKKDMARISFLTNN